MKKFLKHASVLALSIGLMACGAGTDSPKATSTPTPAPAPSAGSTSNPDTTPGRVGAPSSFSGNYSGSYAGTDQGTLNLSVVNAGEVVGSANNKSNVSFSISGVVSPSGALTMNATMGAAGATSFTGTISSAGDMSGTWKNSTGSGTFTGKRQ